MRRNLILAVVVVAALTLAGMGGVFATWSDSEVSHNNTISTGSLDLKVNGADDGPWGTGVPLLVDLECMIPDTFYGPYEIELWNAGQCEFASEAYLHLKRYQCSNILPKVNPLDPADGGSDWWKRGATTGYPAPADDPNAGDLKPEPELVAEHGGKVNCVTVPGIGPEGDECSMGSNVEMIICGNSFAPNDDRCEILQRDLLGKWLCKEIYLFDLMPCQPKTIYLWFWLRQTSEDDYGFSFIPGPGDDDFPVRADFPDGSLGDAAYIEAYDAAFLHWQKFNDWPSWALMKDRVVFDLEFDLWLRNTPDVVHPAGYVNNAGG